MINLAPTMTRDLKREVERCHCFKQDEGAHDSDSNGPRVLSL